MTEVEIIKQHLWDWKWRLTSGKLYFIKDKQWRKVPFIPNEWQLELLDNLHYRNLILKARQRWYSTLVQILLLDQALFYPNTSCWVIAQGLNESKAIFDNKIRFAYDNLPQWLKNERTLVKDSSDTLEFNNWSSVYVSVSFRSGTLQYLHISEYGKICAKFPERAREINTGATESVAQWGYVFIESTAEWKQWDFFNKTIEAQKLKTEWKVLNPLEYKFFFSAWHEDETYRLYDDNLVVSQDTKNYFTILKDDEWIVCDVAQMKWWQMKRKDLCDDMFREYPSYPDEAFKVSIEWSYYSKWINEVFNTQRCCRVPYDKNLPLYTAWDLGWTGWWDNMDIWFFQVYWREFRFIDWFTWIGYSIKEIDSEVLKPRGYKYTKMFLPHDANVESMNDHKTRASQLKELWYEVQVLERTAISDRHDVVRDNFQNCWFDKSNCETPLDILRMYKKKWNESNWCWMEEAEKNVARHTADSFGYSIQSILSFLIQIRPVSRTVTRSMWRLL